MRLRSIKVKSYTDAIAAGVEHISAFGNDDLIPHFITCHRHNACRYYRCVEEKKTMEALFLLKMRKNGIRSAILTMLYLRRGYLRSKEEVK